MDGHRTELITSHRGTDLAVHHFGGNGPVLVLCHATGFHAHCYLPMVPDLAQHFDVWGVDFAGHGGSTPPPKGDFDWNGFADDLLDAVDHIGVDSVRAFGHSMGGTAVLLAEKTRPGVIDAAWLYEPIIFPADIDVPRNSMMADNARRRRPEFASRADALHRYGSRPPLGIMRADALWAYVEHGFHDTAAGTVTLACQPDHEADTFANASTHVNEIEHLSLRATIAAGETTEGPNPAEFAAATAAAMPNAELHKYDQLTHFGPMQDPSRIATDIAAFLR